MADVGEPTRGGPLEQVWGRPPPTWRPLDLQDRLWPALQGAAVATHYVLSAFTMASCTLAGVLPGTRGPMAQAIPWGPWEDSDQGRALAGGAASVLAVMLQVATRRSLGGRTEAVLQDPWEVVVADDVDHTDESENSASADDAGSPRSSPVNVD
jgi:hypothetical protein